MKRKCVAGSRHSPPTMWRSLISGQSLFSKIAEYDDSVDSMDLFYEGFLIGVVLGVVFLIFETY